METPWVRLVQDNGVTLVEMCDGDNEPERLTIEEAHAWTARNAGAMYKACSRGGGNCLWCQVQDALEGIR